MSDHGFDFRPEPPRREARAFEPPPWEREQFEELARQREEKRLAEERAAAEEAAAQKEALLAQAAVIDAIADASPADAATAEAGVATPPAEKAAAVDEGVSAGEESVVEKPKGRIDDRQLEMLMMELKAEEPPALEGAWKVSVGAGVVVVLIGLAFMVWGAVALVAGGQAGAMGAMVLLVFGMAFAGIGGWMVLTGLRQRGVL